MPTELPRPVLRCHARYFGRARPGGVTARSGTGWSAQTDAPSAGSALSHDLGLADDRRHSASAKSSGPDSRHFERDAGSDHSYCRCRIERPGFCARPSAWFAYFERRGGQNTAASSSRLTTSVGEPTADQGYPGKRFKAVTARWHPRCVTDWTWANPIEAGELIAKVNACERLVALVERFPQASDIPPDIDATTVAELQPAGIPEEALAAFEEFGRTTKTFRASLHLARLGYGPQSLMLSTVIYESAMTVLWACEHPDLANHYSSLHARWLLELYSKATDPIMPAGSSRVVETADLSEEE